MWASASTFRFYQMGRSQACIMKTDTVSFCFLFILHPCKSAGKQLVVAILCPNVNFKFQAILCEEKRKYQDFSNFRENMNQVRFMQTIIHEWIIKKIYRSMTQLLSESCWCCSCNLIISVAPEPSFQLTR